MVTKKAPGPMVNIDSPTMLKRWAQYFDCEPEKVRRAVREAGPNVLAVRKWIAAR
jgi:hypothetical protein